MSSEPIKSSGAAASWLQLMETGVFDDCYPHRLNACFHYLSEDQLTFTLKDFIQKAAYVFSYLSFDADKDSNFAAIDIFRNFDRSGTGNISLEDFLLGAIEHLYKVRRNASLLGDIADALLSIESRAIELSTLLEKGNNKNMKFAKFNSNLGAIASIIRADIKACKKTTPILNKSLLVPIFQRAVSQAIADVQSHFHLSSGRMSTLLLTITPEELSVDLTPLPIVWGLRSDGKRSDSAEKAVGKDGEGPSGGHRPSRSQSILQLGGSPEEVLAQLLSSLDENRLKSLQQVGSHQILQISSVTDSSYCCYHCRDRRYPPWAI